MAHGPNVYVTLDVFVTAYRDEYAPPSLKWNGMGWKSNLPSSGAKSTLSHENS